MADHQASLEPVRRLTARKFESVAFKTGLPAGTEVTVKTGAASSVRLRPCCPQKHHMKYWYPSQGCLTFHLHWQGIPLGWHAAVATMYPGEVATFEMSLKDARGPPGGSFEALIEVTPSSSDNIVHIEFELCRVAFPHHVQHSLQYDLEDSRLCVWIHESSKRGRSTKAGNKHYARFHLRVRSAPGECLVQDTPWKLRDEPMFDSKLRGDPVMMQLSGQISSDDILEQIIQQMHEGNSARILLCEKLTTSFGKCLVCGATYLNRLLQHQEQPIEVQLMRVSFVSGSHGQQDTTHQPQVQFNEVVPVCSDAQTKQIMQEMREYVKQGNAHVARGNIVKAMEYFDSGLSRVPMLVHLTENARKWPGGQAISQGLMKQIRSVEHAFFTGLARCCLQGQVPHVPPAPGKAMKLCQKALELDPENSNTLELMQIALHALEIYTAPKSIDESASSAVLVPAPNNSLGEPSRTAAQTRTARIFGLGLPSPSQTCGNDVMRILASQIAERLEQGLGNASDMYAKELLSAAQNAVESEFGPGARPMIERLASYTRRLSQFEYLKLYEPGKGQRFISAYVEGLSPQEPFHNIADHPWCVTLKNSTSILLDELRTHAKPHFWERSDRQNEYAEYAPEWCSILLVKDGIWVKNDGFKRTKAVIESLPEVRLQEVYFARMPAHTKIAPHSDKTNFVLCAHLGLDLVEGLNTLYVGEKQKDWKNGEMFVFDHSYIHSAANNSDRDRYVLFCRFYHPQCTDEECYALSFLTLLIDCLLKEGRLRTVFESQWQAESYHE